LGAEVTILELSQRRLAELDDLFGGRAQTLVSNEANLTHALADADLVIGAVLITGARAPKLIRREHVERMLPGSVIVDVAIDQGGCVETIRPTSHDEPTFTLHDVLHYAVPNMPAAVARTSTLALTSTTLPYGLLIAERGYEAASRLKPELAHGLNVAAGRVAHPVVANALSLLRAA
ncbi:MAG TPA: alanine dehydrogenase, partial [Polyangiales bacterium]|nr:alanine dehydrogenase [Polyangiales bacterium]